MNTTTPFRVCIATYQTVCISETFIRAHIERLPAEVHLIHGGPLPDRKVGEPSFLPRNLWFRLYRCIWESRYRKTERESYDYFLRRELTTFLRDRRIDVVLAEYGMLGADLVSVCKQAGVPLVVHFHGYDASVRSVLADYSDRYATMFKEAAGIVAVSRTMENALLKLGAAPERLHYSPYGVDPAVFPFSDASVNGPNLLAVGRFVDKKAPHLTLLAFAKAVAQCPKATLTMIGDGPLLPVCRDLAEQLKIADCVNFLGSRQSREVAAAMQTARAFVQHSVEAENGDMEGTPVAILEAGCSGLPVVATSHAGIQDVVIDGVTGFLVAEKDVVGMARKMEVVLQDSRLAATLGQNARERITQFFSMQNSISKLYEILRRCARKIGNAN